MPKDAASPVTERRKTGKEKQGNNAGREKERQREGWEPRRRQRP